jgi:chlorobactene glucosyltransferase
MSLAAWLALAGLPACALAMTLVNLASWRRGRAGARVDARVSVLVPARNEEQNIEGCVRAIATSGQPVAEILVYDDQSTDATAAIVRSLAVEIPELGLLEGGPVPAGWVGKPHACHRLAGAAKGDVLVFVDADVRLRPGGLARLLSLLDGASTALVTAVPEQRCGTIVERLLMPLLHVTYTSWLPLALVRATRDPRLVAGNGQLVAIQRDAYRRIGGFAAVAHEIVDDVALCRLAKAQGERVDFADGTDMATCRMYRGGRALWRGFSKNIHEGLGGTTVALGAVIALYLAAFVLPYGALAAGLVGSTALMAPAAAGVAANTTLRALLVWRYKHPPEGILTHPAGVLALVALALNSLRWSLRGQLWWAGRAYPPRKRRLELGS